MTTSAVQPKQRIESIDVLRGIVMVIMVLDHTRDFFTHIDFNPTDLSKASTGLFLTRFITHYCAALFVFLAGTGVFLSISRGKSKGQAARFLISRGLWIVLLEVTLINWGFSFDHGDFKFDMDYSFVFLQVFWAIGVSMIVLAGLIYLPVPAIATIGLILILGHNALDYVNPDGLGAAGSVLWRFLHVQGMVNYAHGLRHIFVLYPLVPWIGVMAVGYSFGTLFKLDRAKRKKVLMAIGIGAIVFFILIRTFNIYGDPDNWKDQGVWYRTILSFINAQKYPPSLDYLLITIGPAMLVLAGLENVHNRLTSVLLVFGRVPLFYYLLHLYLLQLISAIVYQITLLEHVNYGFDLPVVYIVWLLTVFILYFPCRWFMRYKMTHKQWWLSYL